MAAAEAVIRAGLLKLGGSMLEQLLAADNGYRGPRVPCGQGHEAVFAGYRDKSFDTALGLVALTRAWYHCAECERGLAPRDAELGVAGTSMSPGLAAMNDIAATAGPFAGAARLLLHPGQAGQGRVPRPGPGLDQRHRHLRARRHVREPREGRGNPPGRGPRPPVHHPR